MIFPDEVKKQFVYANLFPKQENDPKLVEYVSCINEAKRRLKANETLYVRFDHGDRKGSIAKAVYNPDYRIDTLEPAIIERYRNYWGNNEATYHAKNDDFYVICRWDGRSNKVKASSHELTLLLNYTGPTVWNKFDAKAAKEKLLAEYDIQDIDGKVLSVGDSVLYINARYGSGMELCHGKIKEITAKVDSQRHEFNTVIEKDGDGVISTIKNHSSMIWKKP